MARFAALGLATLALTWPGGAGAAPVACSTLIAGHIVWMGQGTPTGGQIRRRIGAKFARVKITSAAPGPAGSRWGHISVAEGAFGRAGSTMTARFLVAFNDRGFDPARRDITNITLRANGSGEILLRSWGDTRLPLSSLRCDSAGFLTAIESEGNGTSMVTLSLRRETF
ncbi:MAG TPA: hypothetical protein VFZ91_07885 [Allosphingosinicella sp.]